MRSSFEFRKIHLWIQKTHHRPSTMLLIPFCRSWSTSQFTAIYTVNTRNTQNPPNWISLERDISWFWVNFFYLLFKRVTRKPYHLSKAFVSMTSPFFSAFHSPLRRCDYVDVDFLAFWISLPFSRNLNFSVFRPSKRSWSGEMSRETWKFPFGASLGFLSNRAQNFQTSRTILNRS